MKAFFNPHKDYLYRKRNIPLTPPGRLLVRWTIRQPAMISFLKCSIIIPINFPITTRPCINYTIDLAVEQYDDTKHSYEQVNLGTTDQYE